MLVSRVIAIAAAATVLVAACGSTGIETSESATPTSGSDVATISHDPPPGRDPDVPPLPFPDNPDPDQCGIPTQWGDNGQAWLTGLWEGEIIQPDVLLYDSHQRLQINGAVPHGAEVQIILYQANPVLDYYLVDVAGTPGLEGWVPAPFLSFDPVSRVTNS